MMVMAIVATTDDGDNGLAFLCLGQISAVSVSIELNRQVHADCDVQHTHMRTLHCSSAAINLCTERR